ncbi:MAG: hypothetical protein RLZZ292_2078, partial [Bacteroidota bacterium]
MESNIAEIHDKVYEFLTTKHPDLCFTMRQKDRAGRFGLGYWFSGNDDYLAFSFWKGLDWRNKTPNIFFAINADGTPTLEFVSHDNEPMTNLFDALSIPLRTVQKTRTKTKELFEHWVKNYETNDYIAVLDNFIRHDKKMIDKLISVTGLSETLAPIDRTVFEKNNRRVTKTRKDAHNKEKYAKEFINTKSIYVKELTIDKITLFKNEQTINFFDETTNTFKNVTCFIGLNGTGKTSILRAVTLAFLGFENDTVGKDDGLITSRLQNMLNIKGIKDKKKDFVKSGYSKITYQVNDVKGNSKDFANKVVLKNENGTVIIEDDSNSVFENIIDDKPKSLFLAFPQIQGEGSETDEDEPFAVEAPNSKDAISMLNNEPDNRLGRFTKWLKTLNEIANAHQANGIAMPDERKVLDTIFRIIGKVTNDSSDIEYKMVITDDGTDIWLKLDALTGYIPLNLISQGYQNVFGWIGYFMKRLRDVTPKGDDFSQTAAIVLIDEIDTYLHP